jgi:hypothetical protein
VNARLVNGVSNGLTRRKVKLELVEVTQNNHVILADTYSWTACDMTSAGHTAVDIGIDWRNSGLGVRLRERFHLWRQSAHSPPRSIAP